MPSLLNYYKQPLPLTFGMWTDLQLKVFSFKHSDWLKQTHAFITESGAVQLKIDFQSDRLPGDKLEIEEYIEDTSLKIKHEAEQLMQGLWSIFPGKIAKQVFKGQHDLVSTFIFLNGRQIGWVGGDHFNWNKQKPVWDVVTNHFRGKSKSSK